MKRKALLGAAAALALAGILGGPAAAINNGAPASYTLTEGGDQLPIPQTYVSREVWSGEYGGVAMSNPQDLFVARDGSLYIADTGNNRILHLSAAGQLLRIVDNAEDGGFVTPKGVCADEDGTLYVADSGNQRIVLMEPDGTVRHYGRPESDLLDTLTSYEPTKIGVSGSGFLYVRAGKEFMSISRDNTFQGYIGSADVPFSLKNLFVRLFASEMQKRLITKAQPDQYNSFAVGGDGLLYAVSYGRADQIHRITSVGEDTYPKGSYGESVYDNDNELVLPNFTDIAVSGDGILYAAETHSRQIYQYDQKGQLISVFGGEGNNRGHFVSPAAVDLDAQGRLYVLDAGASNIQILQPTDFMVRVIEATKLYEQGDYAQSLAAWTSVTDIHESYPLAYNAIAKIRYKDKDYAGAMTAYRIAGNQEGYGEACDKNRRDWILEHFALVCILLAAALLLAAAGIVRVKRWADRMNHAAVYGKGEGRFGGGRLAVQMLFHPVDGCYLIKRGRDRFHPLPMIVILLLVALCRVGTVYLTHYPLNTHLPEDTSLLAYLALIFLPVFSWIVGAYSTTTLMNGEMRFGEQVTAGITGYVPYVVATPLLILASHLLPDGSAGLFGALQTLVILWMVILQFVCFMVLNDYTFPKAIAVGLVSLVAVLLLWAVVILFFVFIYQAALFVQEVFVEIRSQSLL